MNKELKLLYQKEIGKDFIEGPKSIDYPNLGKISIGDLLEIGSFDKEGTDINWASCNPKNFKIKIKIVGFIEARDKNIYPLVTPDYDGWTYVNSINLKSFTPISLDDSVTPQTKLLYIKPEAIYSISRNSQKGNNNMTSFMDNLKQDGVDGAYRTAARRSVDMVQQGILKMLKDKGFDDGKLSVAKDLLQTDLGKSFISYGLGQGLGYMPGGLAEDPRVKHLAKEFRVEGVAGVETIAMDAVLSYVLPSVSGFLETLPEPVEAAPAKPKMAIVESKPEVEEEVAAPRRKAAR